MPKNTKKAKNGGNRNKQPKRVGDEARVRIVCEDGELYGVVTKFYGNMFDVMCIDGQSRKCNIPNKFRGRNKMANLIATNTWVMVGLRLWASSNDNSRNICDLLEVYKTTDIKHLQEQDPRRQWSVLHSTCESTGVFTDANVAGFEFTNVAADGDGDGGDPIGIGSNATNILVDGQIIDVDDI